MARWNVQQVAVPLSTERNGNMRPHQSHSAKKIGTRREKPCVAIGQLRLILGTVIRDSKRSTIQLQPLIDDLKQILSVINHANDRLNRGEPFPDVFGEPVTIGGDNVTTDEQIAALAAFLADRTDQKLILEAFDQARIERLATAST